MTRKHLSILLASGALIGSSPAFAIFFKSFKSLPPVEIAIPATPDSAHNENSFNIKQLLDSRAPFRLQQMKQDWTTMTTDSAGKVALAEGSEMPKLHTLVSKIRAERFAKGKLKISSPAVASLMLDGKEITRIAKADSAATSREYAVELLPEKDYIVQLNLISTPDDKAQPSVGLEFIADKDFEDVTVLTGDDLPDRFNIKTMSDGPRVSSVSMSPDGKYMVLSYSDISSKKDTHTSRTLMETASGKILTEDLSGKVSWEDHGSTLRYTRKNVDKYDLYTMELPSMKSHLLAAGLPSERGYFTPDGRYLIYYDRIEGKKEEGVMKRVLYPDDRIPGNRDRSYILRYDLQTGMSTPMTRGGETTSIMDISPRGDKLLYASTVKQPDKYPMYFVDLIEMDITTLATDTLIHDNPSLGSADYSPDGRRIFITGGPEAFGDLGKNCGDHEIANDYDTQGYIFDIVSRKVTPVSRDFDPAIEPNGLTWNHADGNIYFIAEEGFFRNLYRLDPNTLKYTKLATKVDYVQGFSVGDDQKRYLAYRGQGYTTTGSAWLLNLSDGKTRLIDNPMEPILGRVEMGKVEPWIYTAPDGTTVDGNMILPPDFDPAKKYPLIVYYYGGTSPSARTMSSPYGPQLLAARDYVVYVLNPSGTTGYGQEFSARHVNAWGKRTAEEIIGATKEFCRTHPFVDDKKVGCMGASYGGFMTQYIQTLTDFFACAVSHAGISNVTSYWGEGYWGYSYNNVAAAKSYPWNNPDLFTKQGSLFNADKIHTPLLLLHGTRDTNVPIGESIQLFNALKILGRDVEFITVEDQDHIISDYDKRAIWQNTITAYFAKYLQDDPRYWDALYGETK